jgi:hypothetical protein
MSSGQRQTKGDYQGQVHSEQMVLRRSGGGGWIAVAKRHSRKEYNSSGTTWLKSTQVIRFSW